MLHEAEYRATHVAGDGGAHRPAHMHPAAQPNGERAPASRNRASTERVVVVSSSEWLLRTTEGLLASERTTVEQHRSLSALREVTRPDLVVLDRQILADPCRDIRRTRLRWMGTAIMVLHAQSTADVIVLIDAGADDATTCGDHTHVSRLHALARRQRTAKSGATREVGDLQYDLPARKLWCAGASVSLTTIEHALMRCLFETMPLAATTTLLTNCGWGASDGKDRGVALRVYIGHLREKIRASRGARIESVHGVGYRLIHDTDDRTL